MVLELSKKYQPYMVELRRHLHMHPELSLQEFETSKLVQRELEKLGIPFEVIPGSTSVMATIQGGKPGKTIALRADMDALPIQELGEPPYKSQVEGSMHACGHDGHTAALLGAAHILMDLREEIAGTVKLFFESGEEFGGTVQIADKEGYLEGIDHCFGIHIWADIPVGRISCAPGARMAGTDLFTLKITGKGAHASTPNQGIDAIVAASSIVMNLQTIVSRELFPQDVGLVTIGKLTAGQRFNAIADEAILEGNLRYFDPALSDQYPVMINRIAENTAAAFRAKSEMIHHLKGTPAVINTEENAAFGQKVVAELFGEDCFYDMPPLMAGEDFAIFMEKVGGLFVFVGGGFRDKESAPHHNGHFDIDEDSLRISAALHAQYAIQYLASHT